MILVIVVHGAGWQDQLGAKWVMDNSTKSQYDRRLIFFARTGDGSILHLRIRDRFGGNPRDGDQQQDRDDEAHNGDDGMQRRMIADVSRDFCHVAGHGTEINLNEQPWNQPNRGDQEWPKTDIRCAQRVADHHRA